MKPLVATLLCISLLSGCATHLDGARYREQTPDFDLFAFFEGDIRAWGLVQNRSGEVVQRFEVDIVGTVDGDRLTLDETFRYALGEGVRKRVWTISHEGGGNYTGSAGDILGEASGRAYGNAFQWAYEMDLPVGDKSYRVKFEDWIFALDDRRIMNRSYIQKFGLDVAEVTIFMERQSRSGD
ncbi:MAG: DUF3833 domain-containing protein [Halieaceae bacterium]|jgi:hypothetical protein|nr:DUF3833 domain-containing protein [Halieaceae bacterium]